MFKRTSKVHVYPTRCNNTLISVLNFTCHHVHPKLSTALQIIIKLFYCIKHMFPIQKKERKLLKFYKQKDKILHEKVNKGFNISIGL